jgi:hypothetical protein
MIIPISPDRNKAKSLTEMAKVTLERLRETDKLKYPSNTLNDYYDIIRELMEALNALDGIKIKGDSAHLKMIEGICENYDIGEGTKQFMQDLREYRNRISYEGFNVKEEFIKSNAPRIEKIISLLFKLVTDRLK